MLPPGGKRHLQRLQLPSDRTVYLEDNFPKKCFWMDLTDFGVFNLFSGEEIASASVVLKQTNDNPICTFLRKGWRQMIFTLSHFCFKTSVAKSAEIKRIDTLYCDFIYIFSDSTSIVISQRKCSINKIDQLDIFLIFSLSLNQSIEHKLHYKAIKLLQI